MPRRHFHVADVFTDTLFGGNPLAVFPDGRGIGDGLMQRIAREFNLSETVFVLPPDDPRHTARLRIFTPQKELPFAGHPTVGTAHVLAATGAIALTADETAIVFEEGVGPVPVTIARGGNGSPVSCRLTAARLPERVAGNEPSAAALAAALGLDESDIATGDGHAIEIWSAGVPFQCVPLRDAAVLARAYPVLGAPWQAVTGPSQSLFVFALDGCAAGNDVQARMFAPDFGIIEDPATGSAVAAFAGYLATRDGTETGERNWIVAQGLEMGRPSRLQVSVDFEDGAPRRVRVGGESVLVSEGDFLLPD